MKVRTWMQKSGATPGKLALVGCLAVVLSSVLWSQHSGEVAQLVELKNPSRVRSPQQSASAKAALEVIATNTEKPDASEQQKWPTMSIEEIVANDPFGVPKWFLERYADTPNIAHEPSGNATQQIELLRKEQTKIVMISNGNRIATIGNESYRVGDTIEGFQVTEISRDGVILREID